MLVSLTILVAVPNITLPAVVVFAPPQDFEVEAAPDSLTLPQGTNAPITIIITSLNGFRGTVSVEATTEAFGLTARVDPAQVDLTSAETGSSTLTLSASLNADLGDHFVLIEGLGNEIFQEVSVSVKVVAIDFSVKADPTSLTLDAGDSGTSMIIVASEYGFTGRVSLEASPPLDLDATLSIDSLDLAAGESEPVTLTITSTPSTRSDSYVVSIEVTNSSMVHFTAVSVIVRGREQTPPLVWYILAILGLVLVQIPVLMRLLRRSKHKS